MGMFFCDGFLHAIVDEELGICTEAKPLRLHQFISTFFRSELNVAENGAGYFIKNGPKASAHHAILQGVVQLNGCVCKIGRTELTFGDLVSLQLEPEYNRKDSELMAWKGSEKVAKCIEGESDNGKGRQGRMMAPGNNPETPTQNNISLSEYEMIKYYREKLGDIWIPEIHESAILQSLPLTLRVLKPSARLSNELRDLGFIPATQVDFSLQLSNMDDSNKTKQLSSGTMHELLNNTWIARGDTHKNDEQSLGVFLSEARLSNEILQQELTSMLPVSILSSKLKRCTFSTTTDVRFLDLCAAPGSKTCQLLSALDEIMDDTETDFTIVANEINPQRANWMRQRLHQQSGSKALANLIVTCENGCAFSKMNTNTFDYILCDVPCSGDGTIRKSPKILSKWTPKNAAKNKSLQKELLRVGLGLLKPCYAHNNNGGLLMYSTCSLNPMENEEVISEVLTEINSNSCEYRFELADLSDDIHSSGVSGNNCNYLRVLPAQSHGGFFVAAIRKILIRDDTKKDIASIKDNGNTKLAKRQVGTQDSNETTTVSYSISPCTQRCCKEITEKMGSSTVVSSGVAILYESKDCRHILAQGVPSLMSLKQHDLVFSHIKLSHSELIDYHEKGSNFREILLPMDRVHNMNCNMDTESLLIIELAKSLTSCDDNCQSFLLPARIVQVNKEESVVAILARPQVYRRALICQLPLNGELV